MTVDRDQRRLSAQAWRDRAYRHVSDGLHLGRDDLVALADSFDALLAELEQAEKERDQIANVAAERRQEVIGFRDLAEATEARLAKVPALVEAANAIVSFYRDPEYDRSTDRMLEVENALIAALEAWEQTQ